MYDSLNMHCRLDSQPAERSSCSFDTQQLANSQLSHPPSLGTTAYAIYDSILTISSGDIDV